MWFTQKSLEKELIGTSWLIYVRIYTAPSTRDDHDPLIGFFWQPSRTSFDGIAWEVFASCSNGSVDCTKYQPLMMTLKCQKGEATRTWVWCIWWIKLKFSSRSNAILHSSLFDKDHGLCLWNIKQKHLFRMLPSQVKLHFLIKVAKWYVAISLMSSAETCSKLSFKKSSWFTLPKTNS